MRRGEWVTLQCLWTVTVVKRRISEFLVMSFPCDMHKRTSVCPESLATQLRTSENKIPGSAHYRVFPIFEK